VEWFGHSGGYLSLIGRISVPFFFLKARMHTTPNNNIVFVDMDTVTNVFIWDHQLTAPLLLAIDGFGSGDYVIALRGETVVGAGRITDRLAVRQFRGCDSYITKRWVRMNIIPALAPTLLSATQRSALKAAALKCSSKFPGFTGVLGIRASDGACFEPLLHQMTECIKTQAPVVDQWLVAEAQKIADRDDIHNDIKVNLREALAGQGKVCDAVFERDYDHIDSDHDLDLVATRIVPWEACTDYERLDPDNYVLMDSQLAEHFEKGLISFRNSGTQFHDSAMDEDAFDPWVDPEFQIPALNAKQTRYMAFHRKYVYKQWRTGMPKPVFIAGKLE
jgi:hypothetical protein